MFRFATKHTHLKKNKKSPWRLQAQFVTRTAAFVNLRRNHKEGELQDRQHEGEAEEDSLFPHTHTHTLALILCVYFPHGKG